MKNSIEEGKVSKGGVNKPPSIPPPPPPSGQGGQSSKKTKSKKEEMTFEISWCQLCGTNMVICPKCGNNCCNGGSGEVDGKKCDICSLAYEYQSLYNKLERFCTCAKECTCKYVLDDMGFFEILDEVNHTCPVHNKLEPDPKCPVHKKREKVQ